MQFSRFRPIALALPIALLSACGDFDRYDDQLFDFPAQAAPPVPHPIPYEPEAEPQPTADEAPAEPVAAATQAMTPQEEAPPPAQAAAKAPPPPPPASLSGERLDQGDDGSDRARPPIEAPRKNVGLKRGPRGLGDNRKELQAFKKEHAMEMNRRLPDRIERANRSGDKPRIPPRAMGHPSKNHPVKKSALSSARDGD